MAFKVFGIQHWCAGHVRCRAGPLQRLPSQPVICDASIRLPQTGELVEHRLGAGEVEALRSNALCYLADNAPVGVFIALRSKRGIEQLHSSLNVCVCTVPVRECHRGQYHVSNFSQFAGEHVLHQQKFQLFYSLYQSAQLTVGEVRAITNHMKRLHAPTLNCLCKFPYAYTVLNRQVRAPRLSDAPTRLIVRHRMVAGQILRRATHILRPLLVRAEE